MRLIITFYRCAVKHLLFRQVNILSTEPGGKGLADGTSRLETARLSLYLPVIRIIAIFNFYLNTGQT